jgi:hypothetical protein
MKAHGALSWTSVGHAANYHDQMHMVETFTYLPVTVHRLPLLRYRPII